MAVAIPFDIINVVGQLHRAVKYTKNELLHLRIRQIQHPLAASGRKFSILGLHNPFGMLLRQTACLIHHFRLNPNSKFQTFLVGIIRNIVNTFRQFFHIDFPIAQTVTGVVASEFSTCKPSIIQHKHFQAHICCVVNHIRQGTGCEIKIGTLPTIEQGRHHLCLRITLIAAGPIVQIARSATGTLSTPGPNHIGCLKFSPLIERITSGFRIDTGNHHQFLALIHLEIQLIISTPSQRTSHNFSLSLTPRVGMKTQQKRRVFRMGGTNTHTILNGFHTGCQNLSSHLHFTRPRAVKVCQKMLAGRKSHGTAGIRIQIDTLLSAIFNHTMGYNHIFFLIRFINQSDLQQSLHIPQKNFRLNDRRTLSNGVGNIGQFRIAVAVSITNSQCGLIVITTATSRIRKIIGTIIGTTTCLVTGKLFFATYGSTIMMGIQFPILPHTQYQR